MKFKLGLIALLVASVTLTLSLPVPQARSQTVQELLQEQEALRQKLDETKNQSRSLSDEVARLNNLVRLNELEVQDIQGQIQGTQGLIVQTNSKIAELDDKLAKLTESINQTQQAANARLRESYKKSRTSGLATIITAQDFQAMLRNLEYLQRTKEEDTRILAEMAEAKHNYETEKANLEGLKKEKESLQSKLQQEQSQVQGKQDELNSNKSQREILLGQSRNEESHYGRLLENNQARIAAMTYLSGVNGQTLGYFNRGELIAYAGSTGCSTGPHVHFGYYLNSNNVNSDINPWPLINSGAIGWPGTPGARIVTQWYGGAHNGIDIGVNENGPLYNAKGGVAKLKIIPKSVINSSSWCGYSDGGRWVKVYAQTDQREVWVYHNDGTMSVYAHVNGAIAK